MVSIQLSITVALSLRLSQVSEVIVLLDSKRCFRLAIPERTSELGILKSCHDRCVGIHDITLGYSIWVRLLASCLPFAFPRRAGLNR